jgi:hypothetical protein
MSSTVVAPESLLRTIASLQSELASLQTALGAEGVTFAPIKGAKAKKVKDPNAEPKEPNVWIKFTQRVGALLKGAYPDAKAPATVGKQFCSFLKEQKPYDEWVDADILEAFTSWTPPEQSKMELAGKTKKSSVASGSSDEGSVSDASAPAPKKRGPLSDEAKAARKEKMDAKKAGAAIAEVKANAAPSAAIAKAFKPKATTSSSYTMEQLTDLDGFVFEGKSYGRNVRGDVVNEDGSYAGHWDGKTILRSYPVPADWDAVRAEMQ